ncbi:GT2 family glycosyltransferase [Actinoalloteichus hoggarensis]|uniref:N-acetylglucosaminyl-diphospho-decaprenol L-rhamnosyltransferase n=1 Tax=Actinoalloteichus hoggarensis TaxID=1470176 RepID=A0A221W1G7_9PSEU|nr:glycosyltransferase [Actinoalloteichus hoggarensis]ASO19590.1 N-acetylglucosaminyl-diphospho-decaprenol L-rhamnosyltransferase [Actinoalloteichus hoggarensis]MBB5919703.1 GT2 family glycosyltransferase [Actinoalloteichus hoggarensis]
MTADRITVVIITRDRREQLLETLAQMTALPDAAPIILVDNGSTDGTADAVAAAYPEVGLIRSARNLGAIGRNLAVRRVRTPYVAFCDDDTRWQPGVLTRAVTLLDRWPGLASVTGRCLVEPDLTEDPITPEMRDSPVAGPDWLPGPALLGVMAGLSAFRVSAFTQVGGFSSRMWLGGEEELLALDLASFGWWMCWVEDMVIHHAPSRQRDARQRRRLGIRNTLWTLWLRRPLRSALRRSAAVLRSAPADRATASAVAAALRGLPWVLRERRVVPARVEAGLLRLEESQRRSTARRYVG